MKKRIFKPARAKEIKLTDIPNFAEENKKILADTKNLVKFGYGDLFGKRTRSLDFKTEWLPKSQAVKVIPLVESYNEFQGKKVAKVLQKLKEVKNVKFGRESSPVVYVSVPSWEKGQAIPELKKKQLKEKIKKAFAETDPDEVMDEYGGTAIRFWWD
jgi:hypothetical protein